MSFKKNFFVLFSSVILVLIGCWLVGIPRHKIVEGLTLVIATVVMSLSIEDLWRKLLTERDKVTWQYVLGFGVTIASVLAWLWASESVTNKEMAIRLGVTFFLAVVDGLWFAKMCKPALKNADDREAKKVAAYREKTAKRWTRYQAKFKKAKTKEDVVRILAGTLRHRVNGNNLAGELLFDQPLAAINDKCYTADELAVLNERTGQYGVLHADVEQYLSLLADTRG